MIYFIIPFFFCISFILFEREKVKDLVDMNTKELDYEQYRILQEALDNGIIDINQTAQKNASMKRDRILKMHQYSIYFREKDAYWYTHLPDETKKEKRRKIKKKNLKDLEDAIVSFYTDPNTEESGMKT